MKRLPEIWFLRFKTIEVFNELCLPYRPEYTYLSRAGITNIDNGESKLGKYYYLPNGSFSGEEITYEQFKQFTTKTIKEDFSYLKKLFKKLNIK
jgi:hypothetical protein